MPGPCLPLVMEAIEIGLRHFSRCVRSVVFRRFGNGMKKCELVRDEERKKERKKSLRSWRRDRGREEEMETAGAVGIIAPLVHPPVE